jgi:hypothetical protein
MAGKIVSELLEQSRHVEGAVLDVQSEIIGMDLLAHA